MQVSRAPGSFKKVTCIRCVTFTKTGNVTIACQAATNGSSYTSMALSFSDAALVDPGLVELEVTSAVYALTTASAPVPANAAYTTLPLYSEGNASVDYPDQLNGATAAMENVVLPSQQ